MGVSNPGLANATLSRARRLTLAAELSLGRSAEQVAAQLTAEPGWTAERAAAAVEEARVWLRDRPGTHGYALLRASPWRRLAACSLDALGLAAIGALYVAASGQEGVVVGRVAFAALWLPYTLLCLWGSGATFGQRLLRLRVISDSGTRPEPGPALARALCTLALFIPVVGLVTFVLLANDREGRGWHDRLTRTRVIHSG